MKLKKESIANERIVWFERVAHKLMCGNFDPRYKGTERWWNLRK